MSDLEEKLESVLGNPQAMAQIMSLAQSLNLGGPGGQNQTQAPSQEQPQEQPQPQSGEARRQGVFPPPRNPPPEQKSQEEQTVHQPQPVFQIGVGEVDGVAGNLCQQAGGS